MKRKKKKINLKINIIYTKKDRSIMRIKMKLVKSQNTAAKVQDYAIQSNKN